MTIAVAVIALLIVFHPLIIEAISKTISNAITATAIVIFFSSGTVWLYTFYNGL